MRVSVSRLGRNLFQPGRVQPGCAQRATVPRRLAVATVVASLVVGFSGGANADSSAAPLVNFKVTGDEIRSPLTSKPGDPVAGRTIVLDRKLGNCLSCHAFPLKADDQGNVGPDLHGVGSRLKPAELRLRVVNMKVLDPQTIMPAYYRIDGLHDVGKAFVGKPILDGQQVEDLVAFLATLKTGVSR
ncbi:MAG: sulfur oxidation c-type cytochrome SoxX [Candidatus Velthaea sp.]